MDPPADPPIRPEQIRGARAMLGWSRSRLARAAGIDPATLARLEGLADPDTDGPARSQLRAVLEAAGIEFLPSDDGCIGVKFRPVPDRQPAPAREEPGLEHGAAPTAPTLPDRAVVAAWCRGARHLLGWSTERLAAVAATSTRIVRQTERADPGVPAWIVARVLAAVREEGIDLSADGRTAWVSLTKPPPDSESARLSALCDAGAAMLGWSADRLTQEVRQHGAEPQRRRLGARAKRAPQDVAAVRAAVEAAGIVFDAEGGMGVGVWLTDAEDAKRGR